MDAAAHIPAYGEYRIPFSVHLKQLDPVIGAHIAHIAVLHIRKAEYLRDLIRILIVVPELVCRYK